jgi:hypothetical protein
MQRHGDESRDDRVVPPLGYVIIATFPTGVALS